MMLFPTLNPTPISGDIVPELISDIASIYGENILVAKTIILLKKKGDASQLYSAKSSISMN